MGERKIRRFLVRRRSFFFPSTFFFFFFSTMLERKKEKLIFSSSAIPPKNPKQVDPVPRPAQARRPRPAPQPHRRHLAPAARNLGRHARGPDLFQPRAGRRVCAEAARALVLHAAAVRATAVLLHVVLRRGQAVLRRRRGVGPVPPVGLLRRDGMCFFIIFFFLTSRFARGRGRAQREKKKLDPKTNFSYKKKKNPTQYPLNKL